MTRRRAERLELLVITPLELDEGPLAVARVGREPGRRLRRPLQGARLVRASVCSGNSPRSASASDARRWNEWRAPWDVLHRTTFYEVECSPGPGEEWEHVDGGHGEDRGALFRCRWHPLPLAFPLFREQDALLGLLSEP